MEQMNKLIERQYKDHLLTLEIIKQGALYQLECAYIARPVDRAKIPFPHQQSTDRIYFSIASIEDKYFPQMRATIDSLNGQSIELGGAK